jgi:hypothetical protein
VIARLPSAWAALVGGNGYERADRARRLEGDEVRDGTQGRCTAEGTILVIRLALSMMVMEMMSGSAVVGWAELQQEGAATGGHETHGYVGTKQKRGQQYDGQDIGSPSVTEPASHGFGRHHARVNATIPVGPCGSRLPDEAETTLRASIG